MKRLLTTLPSTWKGTLTGALLTLLFLMFQSGRTAYFGLGRVLDVLVTMVAALLGVALISLVFALLFGGVAAVAMLILRRRPLRRAGATRAGAVTGLLLGSLGLSVGAMLSLGLPAKPLLIGGAAVILLLPTLLGAAVGFAVSRGWRPLCAALAAVCLSLNVGVVGVLAYSPRLKAPAAPARAPAATLADPTQLGPYAVATLTYGSGTDRRRPEYGRQVDLRTEPVDITQLWAGPKGLAKPYFEWFWGFSHKNVPLNGRVWYPEGAGPFPLVLMVHGNHNAGDFSDAGYAYLGELLASRGYILASVVEDFQGNNLTDTPTQPGATLQYEGLNVTEQTPALRGNALRQGKAGLLTWEAAGASYAITLPEFWQADPEAALTFALGGATPKDDIDVTVELVDRQGIAARLPLSRYGAPLPQPTNPVTKLGLLDRVMLQTGAHGPVPQTFVIPLSDFAAANSAFRPADLQQIRFRFDQTPAGSVVLDDLGFLKIR